MARYREVEERHVYDEGAPVRVDRRPYMHPAAWVIAGLIVLLMIILIVMALGRGGGDGVPAVEIPPRQAPVPAENRDTNEGGATVGGEGGGQVETESDSGSGSISGEGGRSTTP